MAERKPCVTPAVYNLIAERTQKLKNKKPFGKDSKFHLILSGGGPGAAAQVGYLKAMGEKGLHRVFDEIHAVSVGILHGTYFASGQMESGERILLEHVNDRLISVKRWITRKGPLVYVDYIPNVVMVQHEPLRWRGKRRITLHPFAARSQDGQMTDLSTLYPNGLRRSTEVRSAISIGINPPVFGERKKIGPDGQEYDDGGLGDRGMPPWKKTDATHLMVLIPRPIRKWRRISPTDQMGAVIYWLRGKKEIAKRIRRFEKEYHANIKELYAARDNPNYPVAIEIVQLPKEHKLLSTFVRNKELLRRTAQIGYEFMKERLEGNLPKRRVAFQAARA